MWTPDISKVKPILQSGKFQAGVGIVVCSVASSAATYIFTKKRAEAVYEARIAEEVEAARKYYVTYYNHMADSLADPSESSSDEDDDEDEDDEDVQVYSGLLQTYSGDEEGEADSVEEEDNAVDDEVDEEVVHRILPRKEPLPKAPAVTKKNVFERGPSQEWDWETEDLIRAECKRDNLPYIITHEEFMDTPEEFDQGTLTYFNGDGILTDEQDVVIDDEDRVVGPIALTRFGHGSKDNNVVYVRNSKMEMDFEIIRSSGTYTHEVLGFDESEIRHSSAPRKFRRYHE